jgi:predicted XRE-type DNA-binding protein
MVVRSLGGSAPTSCAAFAVPSANTTASGLRKLAVRACGMSDMARANVKPDDKTATVPKRIDGRRRGSKRAWLQPDPGRSALERARNAADLSPSEFASVMRFLRADADAADIPREEIDRDDIHVSFEEQCASTYGRDTAPYRQRIKASRALTAKLKALARALDSATRNAARDKVRLQAAALAARELSQTAIAKHLGVTQACVSQLLIEHRELQAQAEAATALGIDSADGEPADVPAAREPDFDMDALLQRLAKLPSPSDLPPDDEE